MSTASGNRRSLSEQARRRAPGGGACRGATSTPPPSSRGILTPAIWAGPRSPTRERPFSPSLAGWCDTHPGGPFDGRGPGSTGAPPRRAVTARAIGCHRRPGTWRIRRPAWHHNRAGRHPFAVPGHDRPNPMNRRCPVLSGSSCLAAAETATTIESAGSGPVQSTVEHWLHRLRGSPGGAYTPRKRIPVVRSARTFTVSNPT